MDYQDLCHSHGRTPVRPEPWNGHRTSSGLSLVFKLRSQPQALHPQAGQGLITSPTMNPWDRNSTPAGCGCQDQISIYCISITQPGKSSTEPPVSPTGGPQPRFRPYGVGRPEDNGADRPEAGPEIALPARQAASPAFSRTSTSPRGGFRFVADGLGRVEFQLISPGSKIGGQVLTRQFPGGLRCEFEANWRERVRLANRTPPPDWLGRAARRCLRKLPAAEYFGSHRRIQSDNRRDCRDVHARVHQRKPGAQLVAWLGSENGCDTSSTL